MSEPSRSYHHGDLYEALLSAGEAVLAERGLIGFTLRECARRAGVSHAAPKHHFGDTRGFLTQIAARGYKRLTVLLREELAKAKNLDEEFIATTRAYSGFAAAWPEHFRVMFRKDMLDDEDPKLYYAVGETLTELTNVILRQRGEPEVQVEVLNDRVKAHDLIVDILVGWSHIHGIAHLKLEQRLGLIPAGMEDELISRASKRIAQDMRVPPNRPRRS